MAPTSTRSSSGSVLVLAVFACSVVAGCGGCQKNVARVPPAPSPSGKIEVTVTEAGFVPNRIAAKAGVPLHLAITRKTDGTCAREIVFAGQEGATELPLGKTVDVTYVPKAAGDVKFGCGMGMMIAGVISVAN